MAVPGAAAAIARFEYDPVGGRLSYEFPPGVLAASIHRGDPGPDGPVLHRLIDPASPSTRGSVVLPPYQRSTLVEGALRAVAQTADGAVTLTLAVPSR
jgi:hypothetical protein